MNSIKSLVNPKPGDKIRLKSTGEIMIVTNVETGIIDKYWAHLVLEFGMNPSLADVNDYERGEFEMMEENDGH